MEIQKKFLDRFIENLGELFGNHCEIVVHDFTKGFEETVVKIVNGHVSGRGVGACPTNLFFEKYDSLDNVEGDIPIYFNSGGKGQVFKSSTTFIRDENGKVTGAVCINFDVTDLISSQNAIKEFVNYNPDVIDSQSGDNEVFCKNVNELLEYYIKLVEKNIGKPGAMMDKNEKTEALAFLDKKGVLQISKASLKLCEYFHISKFTLYSYLDEVRAKNKQSGTDPDKSEGGE